MSGKAASCAASVSPAGPQPTIRTSTFSGRPSEGRDALSGPAASEISGSPGLKPLRWNCMASHSLPSPSSVMGASGSPAGKFDQNRARIKPADRRAVRRSTGSLAPFVHSFWRAGPPLGEGGEPCDVADADAVALDHDAKFAELAERAREALGLHAEAAGDQRLFIGQRDARGARGRKGLLDEEAGDALRRR